RRGQQLEAVRGQVGEAWRVGDGGGPAARLRRAPPVEVGQRRGLWQVRDAHLFGYGLYAVKLFQHVRGRSGVVVADLFDADDRHPPADQGAKLTARHRRRHQVSWPGDSVNVRVEAARAPTAIELQAALFESKHQEVDDRVQLMRQAHRVHSEAAERMVRLGFEDLGEGGPQFPG